MLRTLKTNYSDRPLLTSSPASPDQNDWAPGPHYTSRRFQSAAQSRVSCGSLDAARDTSREAIKGHYLLAVSGAALRAECGTSLVRRSIHPTTAAGNPQSSGHPNRGLWEEAELPEPVGGTSFRERDEERSQCQAPVSRQHRVFSP